ncbi:MAG: AAA family ATPase [Clostridia bacterium]|nr:AAA family ATPase [Clostridia bacterium]
MENNNRAVNIAKKKNEVTKIVLTGGPCAGKTTAMSKIQERFTQLGYHVVFISETATELISGGISQATVADNYEFQRCLMRLQLERERIYCETVGDFALASKVLVVCDRGAMDNKAYMSDSGFSMLMSSLGVNEIEVRDGYDAVFHLVTAAKGAEEFYTLSNNKARSETVSEAAAKDDALIAAWTGHPHLRVIDNSTDFAGKMDRLIAEISSFLGEPEPLEIERKFLIEYPDTAALEAIPTCRRIEIIQTYLNSEDGSELRIRQRGEGGHFLYYRTEKRNIGGAKRVEIESRLSRDEYLELLLQADTTKRQIRKTRYCLMYENKYFEIDVYPFWNDKAIMEIELSDESEEIVFPDSIKVIKEVTEDPSYKNSALAARKD